MANFYRLENKYSRHGVYYSLKEEEFNLIGGSDCTDRHPSYEKDSKLYINISKKKSFNYNSIRFGFSSIKQLRNWFYNNEILIKFNSLNIILSVYKVPFTAGNCQAVMAAKYHIAERRIKEIDLVELVNSFN